MKTIHIILGLVLVSASVQSQCFVKDISTIKRVEIHDIYGDLNING